LLDRYGIVTRGSVAAERLPGGFSAVYRVLAAFEEAGRCRRGYFVEGLGAAQFAADGAVDRLRALSGDSDQPTSGRTPTTLLLAAADPANPYGAAVPWPDRPLSHGQPANPAPSTSPSPAPLPISAPAAPRHKPGRKAGAL